MKYVLSTPLSIHELGQRTNQEDSLYPQAASLTASQRFFILCDGMGGHESGEVASSTVCDSMGSYLSRHLAAGEPFSNQMFENALSAAYTGLDSKDQPDAVKKMGTTMTFLMFHESGVTAAHMGDSRIYQFRPGIEEPLYKSRDHSLVNDLIMLGELTQEEARTSRNKNVITRAMQPGVDNRAKADITLLTDVKPGDWFYMCSDGMLEQMDDTELGSILTDSSLTAEQKRDQLISKTSGNRDNHTAFIIQVLDVTEDPVEVTVCDPEPDNSAEREPEISDDPEPEILDDTEPDSMSSESSGLPKWLFPVLIVIVGAVVYYLWKSH
ncbi:MAG: serine/threonine-protein phosphatase [Bacteroidaceae bacterium]|nr:serine/threonine-protein phosphatase [Bacteroidaceae bacterium]